MSGSPPSQPLRPVVALAFCVVGFFALVVAGLGVSSLAADADVIAVRGLGQAPGVVGVALACAAFAGALWAILRRSRPSFGSVVVVIAATYLAYVLATGITATIVSADLGAGFAVMGELAAGWPGVVVAAAALVSGWAGVALVRTRSSRPRWPWERDEQ